MIDFNYAQKAFKEYVSSFNLDDGRIDLKIRHTYGVIKSSEYISRKLELDQENVELAKIIALLHDIGRFEQIKQTDSYKDSKEMDHAVIGNDILFNKGLIRNFIIDDQYDNIISMAILNHNKYKIDEGLNEKELLHAKIIRDADKVDNFRVKSEEEFENVTDNATKEKFENDTISDNIFDDFMNNKLILREDRKTYLDFLISCIAFIFDFNYKYGLEYIQKMNYIDIIINRLDYKKIETKHRMEEIRKHALEYVKNSIT